MKIRLAAALLAMLVMAPLAGADDGPTDEQLTRRVEAALNAEPSLKKQDIRVDTRDSVVRLSGYAETTDQVSQAGLVAAGVDRVMDVRNDVRLRINTDPLPR